MILCGVDMFASASASSGASDQQTTLSGLCVRRHIGKTQSCTPLFHIAPHPDGITISSDHFLPRSGIILSNKALYMAELIFMRPWNMTLAVFLVPLAGYAYSEERIHSAGLYRTRFPGGLVNVLPLFVSPLI
jgi:hypothetical protein